MVSSSILAVFSAGLAGCGAVPVEGPDNPFSGATSTDGAGGGDAEAAGEDDSGDGGSDGDSGEGSDGGSGDSGGGADPDVPSLSYGETHQATVDQSDGTAPGYGGLADAVSFEGESGDTVRITMTSGGFDTYLVLQAPDGSVVAQNDDRQEDFNSEITRTLSQSGTYTVWCSSFSESATGAYQLTLETAEDDGGTDLQSIAYGETKTGRIDEVDGTAPEYGGLAEPVTFQGSDGDSVRITMTSEAFDTYLVLQAPDGSVVEQNDDRQADFNSEITRTLSQSGTYTVWCTSWSETATGPYELTLERTG